MKQFKTMLAIMLVVIFILSACAPAVQAPLPQEPAAPSAEPAVEADPSPEASAEPASPAEPEKNKGWINSNVAGSVTMDTQTELKDDFYLHVNRDWLAQAEIKPGTTRISSFADRQKEIEKSIEAILNDDSLSSHEAKLVQQFYKDYIDMETRNKLGTEPLMKYVKEIKNIKNIKELTKYLVESKENTLMLPMIMPDLMDSSRYAVMLSNGLFSLGDADEYKKMSELAKRKKDALDVYNVEAFKCLGYSEDEAKAAWQAAFDFETKLAADSMGSSAYYQPDILQKIYNPVTIDELKKLSPAFPIAESLKKTGHAKSNIIILSDTGYLAKLNELYTDENLEGMKARLLLTMIQIYSNYLDEEFQTMNDDFNTKTLGMVGTSSIQERAYEQLDALLGDAVGKLYAEQYFSEETKADVEEIIAKTMDIYRTRLKNNNWLGEKTKQEALAKLDSLRINVGYPNKWKDYSSLKFKSPDKGGNLMEDFKALSDFSEKQELLKINGKVDKNEGEAISKTHVVNAFYQPSNNSINIPAGILGGVFYDKNGTQAARMGGIGTVIGHEITHAFDTNGSKYDKDGNVNNWWTEEDSAAFKERTDKVAAYFSSIEVLPGEFANGEMVVTEATADLGGISSMLEIAKDIENFDYDDFFNTYAKVWQIKETKESAQSGLLSDPHPPNYLRANITLQQFKEFYDTYGITESNGMYLVPGKRLSVW